MKIAFGFLTFNFLALAVGAAPLGAAPPAKSPVKSAAIAWKSSLPNSALVANQMRLAAQNIPWKKLSTREQKEVRLKLVSAFSLLGRPDWAARYTDETQERDESWRVYVRAAAARNDLTGASAALSRIQDAEARLDASMAIARAHIRAGRLASAKTLLTQIEKALPNAFADRETYSYVADLWRRAGDLGAARRLLARRPKGDGSGFDDDLNAERFFAVRAGSFDGISFPKATSRLALEMVQIWGQGGHFLLAQNAIATRRNPWERLSLLGELARYERIFSSQKTVQLAFLKAAKAALGQLSQVKKPSEWSGEDSEEWPLSIAAGLAFGGHFDSAETFVQASQKRREQLEPDALNGDWLYDLQETYSNPPMWAMLDDARKQQLQNAFLKEATDYRSGYILFLALKFEGRTEAAEAILKRALTLLESADTDDAITGRVRLWLATRAANDVGFKAQAEKLAIRAEAAERTGEASSAEMAAELFKAGATARALALALKNPPKTGDYPGWEWFAWEDTNARDLKSPPAWIGSLRAGSFARVEAIIGWTNARYFQSFVSLADEEDEQILGSPTMRLTAFNIDILNGGWNDESLLELLRKAQRRS